MVLTAQAQTLSKLLFNAQHRLTIAAVFARPDEGPLTYEEVATKASVSRSVAHKELTVLVRIEALQRVEAGRRVHYQRLDSPFWPFVDHLVGLA